MDQMPNPNTGTDPRSDADVYADHHGHADPGLYRPAHADPDGLTESWDDAALDADTSRHAERIAHAFAADITWTGGLDNANPAGYARRYADAYTRAIANPDTWTAAAILTDATHRASTYRH